jgi:hypothetical protein
MLAEIFMVRLEARARVSQAAIPSGDSRFVPVSLAASIEQKKSGTKPDAYALAKAPETF